jgi:cell division protein FtsB
LGPEGVKATAENLLARSRFGEHPATVSRFPSAFGWILPFLVLVVAIVAVPMRVLDEQGLPRYRALSDELRDVSSENERLEREVQRLEREVRDLRSEPETLERIARDELGLVRPGELVFQFPPAD